MFEENEKDQNPEQEAEPVPSFLETLGRKRETKNCAQCEKEFTTRTAAELCEQCSFYADHPEMAPKYWTWHRRASGVWGVQATWPEGEPLPEPGDRVTVHRRNGTSSVETLREVEGLMFRPDATARLTCFVE